VALGRALVLVLAVAAAAKAAAEEEVKDAARAAAAAAALLVGVCGGGEGVSGVLWVALLSGVLCALAGEPSATSKASTHKSRSLLVTQQPAVVAAATSVAT
jgi:hypothetical protein